MNKALIRIRHIAFKVIVRILSFPEPEILSGRGQSSNVYKLMLKNNCKKPLIVTDKMLIKMSIIDGLIESLRANKIDYVIFNGVQPNPTINNIEEGVKFYKDNKCDSVIAFGGGSSIDCAKIIAARITNNKDV
ncbi:MAG: iron-containing alcohol dehydrogenase, partial [Dethiosulfatibacter sp.]|nr:iron-containing alcohol dehydrogenase [Dethiosulfatibacter sp.]